MVKAWEQIQSQNPHSTGEESKKVQRGQAEKVLAVQLEAVIRQMWGLDKMRQASAGQERGDRGEKEEDSWTATAKHFTCQKNYFDLHI